MADLRLFRGDTWQRAWLLRDAAGAVVDLTGASARLHVRDATGTLAASASIADGRLLLSAGAGRIDLVMPAAVMAGLLGRYRYDLEVSYPSGTVRTYEAGALVVLEDVSRD